MSGHIDLGSITPTRYFSTIAVVLGLLFGLTGNEDGQSSSFLYLLRWQLQSIGAMGFLVFSHAWLWRLLPSVSINPWASLLVSGIVGLALFSPFNLLIDVFLDNEYLRPETWVSGWLEELSYLVPPALVAWLAINGPWVLGYRLADTGSAEIKPELQTIESEKQTHTKESAIADVPINSQRVTNLNNMTEGLLYLKAELHYLSVVTDKSKTLLLCNLKDAIDELGSSSKFDGFQCHRSYWVNSKQVVNFKRLGRQGVLLMTNGEEIPVSRKQVAEATTKFPK